MKTETVICNDSQHAHTDPRQDVMTMHLAGHEVIVESERGSLLYSVWIDGQESGAFITSAQLDKLIKDLQP